MDFETSDIILKIFWRTFIQSSNQSSKGGQHEQQLIEEIIAASKRSFGQVSKDQEPFPVSDLNLALENLQKTSKNNAAK